MINSMLLSLFFDVTSLQIFDVKLVSMLQFSMFPYSMLPSSIFYVFELNAINPEDQRKSNGKNLLVGYLWNWHLMCIFRRLYVGNFSSQKLHSKPSSGTSCMIRMCLFRELCGNVITSNFSDSFKVLSD